MNKKLQSICNFDEPMKNHTSFKIGGQAKYFFEPQNLKELKSILKFCNKNNIKYEIIGNGSNILFSSKGFDGAIIKIAKKFFMNDKIIKKIVKKYDILSKNIKNNENNYKYLFYSSGTPLVLISGKCLHSCLSNMEFAVSIPGTLAGAITMNAGAFDGEISNVVELVVALNTENLKLQCFTNSQCDFSYRNSVFQNNSKFIILGAFLKLKKSNHEFIKDKMSKFIEIRKSTQNVGYPSAGSVFKRQGDFVPAKFFDEQGLKGTNFGDAELSTVHSGYIVNKGNATSDDVLNLIDFLTQRVGQISNNMLELEIKKMGDFNN